MTINRGSFIYPWDVSIDCAVAAAARSVKIQNAWVFLVDLFELTLNTINQMTYNRIVSNAFAEI